MRFLSCCLVALGFLIVCALHAVPAARAASLQQVGTYASPVFVTSDPQDADRLFVVEQGGGSNPPRIRLTAGGTTTTFLDASALSSPGVAAGGESGLLSMAFAPDFAASGRFYVFYTGTDSGALHVDEFTASGDTVDVATRNPVITIPHPTFTNHNGGQLQFGPDGYLYISTGDGGSSGDPDGNGQNVDSLLGKILRIAPTPGGGYTSPAGNPFFGTTPGADQVWSYGLRNPWRFSFDRLTGDLFVGDVGQAAWEEVSFDPASLGAGRGDNFGWDCFEGRHPFQPVSPCPAIDSTLQPALEYPNPGSGPSAVAGGYVVRDPSVCELYGRYVYADTYAGQLRSFVPAVPDAVDDRSEGLSVPFTTSFGEDAAGRVYVASSGSVYRIVHTPGAECPPPTPGTGDSTAPVLTLDAKRKQSISERKVSVTAAVDELSTVALHAAVTRGHNEVQVFHLPQQAVQIPSGEDEKLAFKLKRGEARRVRRLIGHGFRVEVVFTAAASDAAGNQSEVAGVEVRIKQH